MKERHDLGAVLVGVLLLVTWPGVARAGVCVSRNGSAPTKGMDNTCFSNEDDSLAININTGNQIDCSIVSYVIALGESRAMGRNASGANAQGDGAGGSVATAVHCSQANTRGADAKASAEYYSKAEATNKGASASAQDFSSAEAKGLNSVAEATDSSCAYETRHGGTSVAVAGQCVRDGVVVWDPVSQAGDPAACRCLILPSPD